MALAARSVRPIGLASRCFSRATLLSKGCAPQRRPLHSTTVCMAAVAKEVFTAEEAADLMAKGYQYVDVRGPDEFVAGHAPGAVNIPLGPTLPAGFKDKFPLGTEKLLVGCLSGKRSGMAMDLLAGAYPEAINFRGSYMAWSQAGMPIEK